MLWLVWLGGALNDQAYGIALDNSSASTPNVYITGQTASLGESGGIPFPTLGNPAVLQACSGTGGTTLAFVAGLSQSSLNVPSLVYSTCWGGVQATVNTGNAIAVDSLGAAYVTGTTYASNFPVLPTGGAGAIPPPYNTEAGAQDGFVFKIAPAGVAVVYSMLLGQTSGTTYSNAIAVDAVGNAWVTGLTTSDTFPATTGHFASARVGAEDAFVAEVVASGIGLGYATYIQGNLLQWGTGIALDNKGVTPYNVFVTGTTNSPTTFPSAAYYNLPTTGTGSRSVVYQKDISSGYHPFVLRLNPNLANPGVDNPQEMVYATHLGSPSSSNDYSLALALDDRDDAYITGNTLASDWTITEAEPLTGCLSPCVSINATPTKLMHNQAGGQTAFVTAIGPTGLLMPFFSYMGATSPGFGGTGIAIDSKHNIYVAGYAPDPDFPLVTGSLMDGSVASKSLNGTNTAGLTDGFVTKIAPVLSFGAPLPPPAGVCTISAPPVPAVGSTVGGTTVTITGTGFSSLGATNAVLVNGVASSSYTVNSTSTSISAVIPPLAGTPLTELVPLTVTTPAGTCSTTYGYVVATPGQCKIAGVDPNFGFTVGGGTVSIIGIGFNSISFSSAVTFGGNDATKSVDPAGTLITATVPRHPLTGALASGEVTLSVTGSSGTCTASYNYVAVTPSTCTISGISPSSGFTTGDTEVTIVGTNFSGLVQSDAVTFDGIAASTYVVTSSTTIFATTPRHPLTGSLATGSVSLLVTTVAGTCSTSYTYDASPVSLAGCGNDYFFPSPAGPTGAFAYCMSGSGHAIIKVYNAIGDLVAKLDNNTSACTAAAGGTYACQEPLNTARLAPGVYLYRIEKFFDSGNSNHSDVKKFAVRH
jgi:hypothetical protein